MNEIGLKNGASELIVIFKREDFKKEEIEELASQYSFQEIYCDPSKQNQQDFLKKEFNELFRKNSYSPLGGYFDE